MCPLHPPRAVPEYLFQSARAVLAAFALGPPHRRQVGRALGEGIALVQDPLRGADNPAACRVRHREPVAGWGGGMLLPVAGLGLLDGDLAVGGRGAEDGHEDGDVGEVGVVEGGPDYVEGGVEVGLGGDFFEDVGRHGKGLCAGSVYSMLKAACEGIQKLVTCS